MEKRVAARWLWLRRAWAAVLPATGLHALAVAGAAGHDRNAAAWATVDGDA
jgi:hypothetical protein